MQQNQTPILTMKSVKQIAVLLILLVGICQQAYAQLGVRLEAVRRDYVLGENVVLKISIVNHTDSSVALTNVPGRCWLDLQVKRSTEMLPESPVSVPRYPALTITPGSSRAYNIGLKPHFALNRPGSYSVVATLRMPDMKTTYSSNSVMFTLSSGANVRSFNVQVRGQRLKLGLKTLNIRGRDLLFGQVMNESTQQVVGACCLGQYLNFMAPKVLLDRAQNMHMLCQSSAEFFTYSVMDTYGVCKSQQLMKRTGGPVDLISTGGGIRCIGLTPYKQPTQVKENIHSASDRP